jgi:hypothetical protein
MQAVTIAAAAPSSSAPIPPLSPPAAHSARTHLWRFSFGSSAPGSCKSGADATTSLRKSSSSLEPTACFLRARTAVVGIRRVCHGPALVGEKTPCRWDGLPPRAGLYPGPMTPSSTGWPAPPAPPLTSGSASRSLRCAPAPPLRCARTAAAGKAPTRALRGTACSLSLRVLENAGKAGTARPRSRHNNYCCPPASPMRKGVAWAIFPTSSSACITRLMRAASGCGFFILSRDLMVEMALTVWLLGGGVKFLGVQGVLYCRYPLLATRPPPVAAARLATGGEDGHPTQPSPPPPSSPPNASGCLPSDSTLQREASLPGVAAFQTGIAASGARLQHTRQHCKGRGPHTLPSWDGRPQWRSGLRSKEPPEAWRWTAWTSTSGPPSLTMKLTIQAALRWAPGLD